MTYVNSKQSTISIPSFDNESIDNPQHIVNIFATFFLNAFEIPNNSEYAMLDSENILKQAVHFGVKCTYSYKKNQSQYA